MAKYTDPNTGVKYSTHTGLKVFTVIVVILLVISIVLNIVLYTQNSDGELDSGESGELGDDYADGDDGEGDVEYGDGDKEADDDGDSFEDGSNDGDPSEEGDGGDESGDLDSSGNSGGLPPVDESIVDTVTVIENERVVLTSDFDEYGTAAGLYYYPDKTFLLEDGSTYIGCGFCEGPCEGHEVRVTKGGTVYSWKDDYEPIVVTQVLYAEDGSTDINSEIRASIVFNTYLNVTYEEYYYNHAPSYIEIVSLTGDPLEIESVEFKQYTYYERTDDIYHQTYTEYRSESGVNRDIELISTGYERPDVTTVYGFSTLDVCDGEATFTLTLSDGSAYSFEYWVIGRPDLMIGSEVVYIA